jgi:hypothetical protein
VRPSGPCEARSVAPRQARSAFCSLGLVEAVLAAPRPFERGFHRQPQPAAERAWLRIHPFARREQGSLLRGRANASNHRGTCLRRAENVDQTWCADVCGYLSFAPRLARAAGKVIEGRARLVIEAPKVVEGPRSPLPVRELEVACASTDLKKRESPGWGLRGFPPGLEAGRGFRRLRCSGWGSKGDLSGDGRL